MGSGWPTRPRRGRTTEVIVRPYPDVEGGYFQVSQGGGDDARWSPDGGQLFYRNGQAMMKVDVAGETPATWSRPVQLFCGGLLRRRPR